MLLSPGHSPRQISPSSTPSKTLTLTLTPIPPNPKKRLSSVLDEDTYISSIEKIIERDFFPDIPNLRDRLDWLEASRSGDPIIIRDAQLKILDRRAGKPAGKPAGTTPSAARTTTPFSSLSPPASPDPKQPSPVPFDASLSLDEFCGRYTSEDNASFARIMESVNRKRRERYAHLLQGEMGGSVEDAGRDRITDGYGTSGQPLDTLNGWKYTAKNLLMYNPVDRGEVPLTEEEMAERLKGLTKEIDRSNTRFHEKCVGDLRDDGKEEEADTFLYTPVAGATPAGACWPFGDRQAEKLRKYDLEDLKKTPDAFFDEMGKKGENGYSFVKTPSPAPGVDESPFMTWGAIEGTPLRLDLEEGLVGNGGSSDGPHFSIPLPPTRDVKAHSLSRDATRRLRERSRLYQKPPLPSPARGGSVSPSVRNLSPAAQKFVRNAIAKSSCSVDETLRASYRGTSPAASTPKRRSLSRFSRDGSLASRSPSVKQDSASPCDGPHFSIPLPPTRDVKAHSLSRDATRRLRERSRLYQKPPLPSPARGGSVSPSVRNLSPAAQKFVRNAIAKSSCSVDETLRASYRGTSPAASTPKRRSLSRFSRDGSLASRSPSVKQDSASPW